MYGPISFKNAFVALFIMATSTSLAGPLPSFPGAEGFGAVSVGGRGGRVIKVTNLNPNGPGSFQAACAAKGPRIVVFEVGGVIRGDIQIMHSNITIAGQSAPKPGITLVGRIFSRYGDDVRLHDIVIRHIRIRPPVTKGVEGDAVQLSKTERVILDHLSLAWANDEVIDIIHSSEVTIQWSTIEESDVSGHAKNVAHNFAILSAYPGSGNVSIHHNLFAHHSRRLPSMSPQVEGKPNDFRNNIVYNFRDGLSHEGHEPKAPMNVVGNYYKRGPNSSVVHPFMTVVEGSYYIAGNYFDGVGVLGDPRTADPMRIPGWIKYSRKGKVLKTPARVAAVATQPANQSYDLVMANAGAWPRDRVTLRTIMEVKNGSGSWGRHGPTDPDDQWLLSALTHEVAQTDSDGDGMPDSWERANGLNPRQRGDATRRMPSGYTAIEEYLNERARALLSPNADVKAKFQVQ